MEKSKWLEKNGFNINEITYCIIGENLYSIKEELKAEGCKYNRLLGWHRGEPLPPSEKYTCAPFTFDELYAWCGENEPLQKDNAKELIDAATRKFVEINPKKFFPQAEGFRFRDLAVKFERVGSFSTKYGLTYVYTFTTENYHFTWFTKTLIEAEVGDVVTLTATIKEFQNYKGINTTIITRAKISYN